MKCNHALTDANNPTGNSWKHGCALCEIDQLKQKYDELLEKHSDLSCRHEMVLLRLEMSEGKIIYFIG